MKMRHSKELAYWIGVMQTDGCLYKSKNSNNWKINIDVGIKSLPMLTKFVNLSKNIFGLDNKITKKKTGYFRYHVTVTKLLEIFKDAGIEFGDPPKPPEWSIPSINLFGSYLAGVIDGDGSVRTMNIEKYPECVIKISSGHKQEKLASCIKSMLNCAVRITEIAENNIVNGREFFGRWYDLEFYVSSKNYNKIKKSVIPFLAIPHKINKLNSFIQYRYMGKSSSLV